MWLLVYSNDHAPLTVRPIYSSSKLRTAQMMIFSLVAMIGLEKCCITSACLQWLCHSGERTVARGPLVLISAQNIDCGYSLEPPRRGGPNEYPQPMFWAEIWKKNQRFCLSENFQFLEAKISIYLNRLVFVMFPTGHYSETSGVILTHETRSFD